MFNNMFTSLVLSGKIVTTLTKAKSLRPYAERLITKAKQYHLDVTVNQVKSAAAAVYIVRDLIAKMHNDAACKKLITDIAPKVANRAGGYLRIIQLDYRSGDKADRAIIEFVDEVASTQVKNAPELLNA